MEQYGDEHSVFTHANGNESLIDAKPPPIYLLFYAVHLLYGIPSLISYFMILHGIKHSPLHKMPFYKLFIVDGIIVSILPQEGFLFHHRHVWQTR